MNESSDQYPYGQSEPAQNLPNIAPLVDPSTLPAKPELRYHDHNQPAPALDFTPSADLEESRAHLAILDRSGSARYAGSTHLDPWIAGEEPSLEVPEGIQAPLATQRESTGEKVGAILVSILVHVAIALLFWLVVIAVPQDLPPQITATTLSNPQDQVQQRKLPRRTTKKPSTPSENIAQIISADTVATLAAPTVDFEVEAQAIDLGTSIGFGSGFGTSDGFGELGMGGGGLFGSRGGERAGLTGRLFDIKQDRSGDPVPYDGSGDFYTAVRSVINGDLRESSFKDYYEAKTKLGFSFLAIPYLGAEEGPKAFDAEKEIQPRGWFVHYSGRIRAPHPGKWRFAGTFDDLLIVRINGKTVLDASWDPMDPDWTPSELESHPSYIPKPIRYGDWVSLNGVDIDILVGERPGGFIGGTLLIQEKGKDYEIQNGRPVLPVFSTVRLSEDDNERLQQDFNGFKFAKETPGFRTSSR